MRALAAVRRVLLVIRSLVAAGLTVSMFVTPLLQAATGAREPARDPAISAVVTVVIVVLGGLIYREILRSAARGTHETTPTSSGG